MEAVSISVLVPTLKLSEAPLHLSTTHLLEHIQDELQVDLVDAHGERLVVHALAEVA